MKHAVDMTNPITDEHAARMYVLTPREAVPEVHRHYGGLRAMWENAHPDVRECFRARARRSLQGDDSFAPWRFRIPAPISVT